MFREIQRFGLFNSAAGTHPPRVTKKVLTCRRFRANRSTDTTKKCFPFLVSLFFSFWKKTVTLRVWKINADYGQLLIEIEHDFIHFNKGKKGSINRADWFFDIVRRRSKLIAINLRSTQRNVRYEGRCIRSNGCRIPWSEFRPESSVRGLSGGKVDIAWMSGDPTFRYVRQPWLSTSTGMRSGGANGLRSVASVCRQFVQPSVWSSVFHFDIPSILVNKNPEVSRIFSIEEGNRLLSRILFSFFFFFFVA